MIKHKMQITNVRLSFPSLFKRATFNGVDSKYEATFLFDKNSQMNQVNLIGAILDKMQAAAGVSIAEEKRCLRDGDKIEYSGYANHYALKSSTQIRPVVVHANRAPITEEDAVLYAGCYVNAIIELWVQQNSFGKRINCMLYGVQFAADGESFGISAEDLIKEFSDLTTLEPGAKQIVMPELSPKIKTATQKEVAPPVFDVF